MRTTRTRIPAIVGLLALAGIPFVVTACNDSASEGLVDILMPDNGANPPDLGPGIDLLTSEDSADDTTQPDPLCPVERGFGCACDANGDCDSGLCIDGPDGRLCTRPCVDSCPDGFDCRQTSLGGPDVASICVPRHVSLCRPCLEASDCRLGSDTTAHCVPALDPDEGSFCATSCASIPCPDGYTCSDVPTGQGDATARLCLRAAGALCECRPSWAALPLETACARANDIGRCKGRRSCGPDGLTACSAPLPAEEICNGADDDCNSTPDDIQGDACALETDGIETTCPGITVCSDGALACAGRAPAIEICDGLDNDCDGATDGTTRNCVDAGCVQNGLTFVENGPPSCTNGQCAYENPKSCGYFRCSANGGVGDVCATACTDDSRCIDNATCVNGACTCRTGYAGPACRDCALGWQDNDGDGVCKPGCTLTPCSEIGGACSDADGTARCNCNEGYVQADCAACDQPNYTDPDRDGTCVRRGEVLLGPPPPELARVGKTWRYTLTATQAGFMPNDAFVYSKIAGPTTMAIDPATGAIAWTPDASEQTWDADPALSDAWPVVVRATAPDGQFAEHAIDLVVLPPVLLEGLHPAAGRAAGNEPVLVFGSGFVGPPGSFGVDFGTIPAASITVIDPWTLSVTTPRAPALTRPLVVTLDGQPEVELRPGFTHLPRIATSVPSITAGSTLAVTGEGFDNNVLAANVGVFPSRGRSERRARATGAPDQGELVIGLVVASDEATYGTGAFSVLVNGLRSNHLPIEFTGSTLTPRLAVTSFDGPRAPGQSMQLRGTGFAGLATTDIQVAFQGAAGTVPATVTAINVSGTAVTVTVPTGAVTGRVTVSATGRTTARSFVAAVIPDTTPPLDVFGITPEYAAPGEALIIEGQGFVAATPAVHTVSLDGVPARIISAESNRLVIAMPSGLPLGPARVRVDVGDARDETAIVGVSGAVRLIAGGGPGVPVPLSPSPTAVPVDSVAATDPDGLVAFSDGERLRLLNTTAAPVTAFGQTIASNTAAVLLDGTVTAAAFRPLDKDLFVARGTRILRVRRNDGTALEWAGSTTPGNSGDDGSRLDAAFTGISHLAFTSASVLVIMDTPSGTFRAVNTVAGTRTLWGLSLPTDIMRRVASMGTTAPQGMAVAPDDSLYVADFANLFRIPVDRLPPTDPNHVVWTQVSGRSNINNVPTTGCPASTRDLGTNGQIAIDPDTGDLWLGSRHGLVRRIIAAGGSLPNAVDGDDCVENFAGLALDANNVPQPGFSGDGGPATEARLPLVPRPIIGPAQTLLIASGGRLRSLPRNTVPAERIITTLAGAAPLDPTGQPASILSTTNFASRTIVDSARNRYLMPTANRVLGIDRATGLVSVVAGTGIDGNLIPPDGNPRGADIGSLRNATLSGNTLFLMETLLFRVSAVDLSSNVFRRVAGDGRAATSGEIQFIGPALSSRVGINTGRPKSAVDADGLYYFADNNTVRIINPTDTERTAFGRTVAAGGITWINLNLGSNLSGIAFDRFGDLWVASSSVNRLARLRRDAPTTVEWFINPAIDGQVYGRFPAGRLADLRVARLFDIAFLPNGDLMLAPHSGSQGLLVVRADADGRISGNSLVAPILGHVDGGTFDPGLPTASIGASPAALAWDPDLRRIIANDQVRILAIDAP